MGHTRLEPGMGRDRLDTAAAASVRRGDPAWGAPRMVASGILMLGPVLIRFGTEEQKRRYLPDIAKSRVWWCQGFSEPGSGSDLASMRTRAVRRHDSSGDHFVVNGQKAWTSYAQFSEMMFCLVRSDPDAAKP